MTAPRVVGIDLSLTSTGLADNLGYVERVQTKPGRRSGPWGDLDRIEHIASAVTLFADWGPPGPGAEVAIEFATLVAIEGPAFSRGAMGGQHVRAGLYWHVLRSLYSGGSRGPRILVVPPNSRAMYATGRGTAGKDEVLAAAIRRYPAWDITGNDVADAVILAAIGARLLGHPVEESLPQTHLRALAKLALPTER